MRCPQLRRLLIEGFYCICITVSLRVCVYISQRQVIAGAPPRPPLPQLAPRPPPSCGPGDAVCPAVPSEISSQSSDEETRSWHRRGGGRRRRGGGASDGVVPPPPPSSLVCSRRVGDQLLTQSESSGGETTATELCLVPDPDEMRRYYRNKANRTVAEVPKTPSRIKREVVSPRNPVDHYNYHGPSKLGNT